MENLWYTLVGKGNLAGTSYGSIIVKRTVEKMAKLYFKFGAMGSSKTAQALMTKFNYEEKGSTVWLIKPSVDTRDDDPDGNGGAHILRSRIGLFAEADVVTPDQDVRRVFTEKTRQRHYDVIICDECQFLTEKQVGQMKDIADLDDVPVMCFGLRTDFQTKMFPGSKRLFEIADSITEIKSICRCGRKATVNARFDDSGKIITEGDQVCLGGNDRYESMCYSCYRKLVRNSGK